MTDEPPAGLAADRLELLRRLLDERRGTAGGEPQPPIPHRPAGEELPLSHAQQRLWFLDRLSPGTALYNVPRACRFAARLDARSLAWGLEEVVRRHESLRTTFAAAGGRPRQVVRPAGPRPLPVVDLSALPAARREEGGHRLATEEARRPFDLAAGPLVRLTLLRLGPEESWLLLTVHHAVADGWSLPIVWRELGGLYEAALAGGRSAARAAALPPPAVQFGDYVQWQRRRLAGEALEGLIAWWRQRLAGCPPVLDLPADRHRPPVQDLRGARRRRLLPHGLGAAVGGLARRSATTRFVVCLAALGALLARLTGREDLAVGSPVANRTRPELAGVVGFFANTLVLRVEASGSPDFSALVERVRGMVAGALAHQELPFERLVEALQPERDLAYSPLFQVMFLLVEQEPAPALGGRRGEPVTVESGTALADLTVCLEELAGGGLAATAEYATALFDATTVDRLLRQLERLLAAAAAQPATPLRDLPLLAPAERAALLAEWNDTARPAPEGTVAGLFASRAALAPAAVALVAAGSETSYGELRRRSGRLAAWLRALGARPETRVGIFLDRSAEMVAAVLAVLEAGAAYVPLDPALPRQRLDLLLHDASAAVLITRSDLLRRLPEHGARLVLLEPGWERTAPSAPPGPPALPDNVAYVLFTSGSTGRPKGVQVTHGGLTNLLASVRRQPGLPPGGAMLAVTTLSFDIATVELLLPLSTGGRVVLASDEEVKDGAALARLFAASGVDAAQGTPATYWLLLSGGWRAGGATLFCAGEILSRELADRLLAGGGALWNLYGPTETTIYSTLGRVEAGPVTAGRPVARTRIHVVDEGMALLPAGAPGEVLIGGAGLARGYLDRPDQTAERFVPDPFGGEPGGRLYRTGDLGRLRADGRLEILGRIDRQVKVRGFRVEPEEIEAVLARHPAVDQTAVAAREAPGGRRLVAWFVPRQGAAAPPTAELRDFLRERLPESMVPSSFVAMGELPLTPSGKVDRRALPDPEAAGGGGEFVAPRGRLELALAALWREVLGRQHVGIRDNFFDLGGHSLLLAEVQGRLAAAPDPELRREVAVVDLFRHPTVESLARFLGESTAARPRPRRPRRREAREREPVAVVGMAGRFPGCRTPEELWQALREGRECLTTCSEEDLLAAGVTPEELADPRYVRVAGELEDARLFDAEFFGVTPREAEILDPQHRVFLECAWEALEDAGCDPGRSEARIGVYAATGLNSYLLQNLGSHPALMRALGGLQTMLANDKDFLATRVSYKLDLRGPSLAVQTGCSSSLVAVHLAVQALLAGECDMALAGGVKVSLPLGAGYLYQEGGILSPDGHCRAFDARAQGTVGGSGAGVVVLERLSDALAAGHRVRAVVLGSAINNDGSAKVGFTAPSVDGQAEVVAEAMAAAGVAPRTIGYVEAHGTGTALGDPIEVAALNLVFGGGRPASCALGSIKTNLGHLDTAAGIAGFIKAVLALEHGEIPPSLHFGEPNPEVDFAAGPFYVNTRLTPWRPAAGPRRAGVSSFGVGGTNAHVVLEEAPGAGAETGAGAERPWQVLVASARSEAALAATAERLADHLRRHPDLHLPDVAYTLQLGRAAFDHRLALVCRDAGGAAAALGSGDPARLAVGARGHEPAVAFLFPGQGAQHPGMAGDLYRGEPVFRAVFDRCAERLAPALGCDLRRLVHPAAADAGAARRALDRTSITQPALFAVEYSLAQLWIEWGVRPQAMLGHSIGELVAACLAGVFTLEDALDLVALRGRLLGELPGGAMLGVRLGEADVLPLLGEEVELAAVNGPAQVTVAGPEPAIEALARRLHALGVPHRRLRTSHAFHTAAVVPIMDRFAAEVAHRRPVAPRLPWISNVTGDWIDTASATDPSYWARHLRRPVRFADGTAKLLAEPGRVFLEVGPGRTLTSLVCRQPRSESATAALASLPEPTAEVDDHEFALGTLGRLWVAGVEIDWERFHRPARRRCIGLPTYPFEHRRFWIDAARAPGALVPTAEAAVPGAGEPTALYAWSRGSAPYAAPETEIELRVSELWQEHLGIAQVGRDDNFFALGGDSLTATLVVSRLGELFPLELGLKAFFEAPTVRGLAAAIEAAMVAEQT